MIIRQILSPLSIHCFSVVSLMNVMDVEIPQKMDLVFNVQRLRDPLV